MTSLKRLVTELPAETDVYPGHGEATTTAELKGMIGWLAGIWGGGR